MTLIGKPVTSKMPNQSSRFCVGWLPILLGGAKELEIVHINIIRGSKEPRNLQNHRGVG